MNKKKHIDRLFQDKLQNFEATPSDAVWKNINAKLNLEKEKDRKVIPIWWKVAGIAAGLLLLITLSNALFFNSDTPGVPENEVVNTEEDTNSNATQKEKSTQDNTKIISTNNLENNDAIVLDENTNSNQDSFNTTSKDAVINNQGSDSNALINSSNKNTTANVVSSSQSSNTGSYKNETGKQNLEKNAVAENSSQELKNKINKTNTDTTSQIDENKLKELTNSTKKANSKNAVTNTSDANKKANTSQINKNEVKELTDSDQKANSKNVITDASNANEKDNTEATVAETKTDEEKLSVQEELEKANEEKDVLTDEEKKKRWSVAPNIAPVYFNAFGSGSSIDSKFDNSPKSGEINMSYGVAANYQINDKLSIRAGVNQVKLGYNINNVIVYNNIETEDTGKPLRNVALNSESQNLSFLSSDGLSFGQVPDVVANNISSSIEQRLGFIEIPVEAEYKLSDKKFGLSLIGGFSTLFLSENEVYSTLQNERQLLGEATNINKTSFSANLGVGVRYKISEKINLNLEPVFKYQLNTFSNTSGSFNPYTIGVYSGFSFKF